MRIGQNKSGVEKQETKQDVTLCEPERFTKGTVRNLTMLDTIGLVALTVFQSVLFQGMRIGSDSRKEKDDNA